MSRTRSFFAHGTCFSGRVLLITAALTGAAGLSLLTGCGADSSFSSGAVASSGAMLRGSVHGGQQPVTGATIALYAASTAGYPTDSSTPPPALITTQTDPNGNFTLPAYTCPAVTGGSQVYLLAMGGNPGNSNGADNPNLVLMAALGTCPSSGTLAPTLFINIDEVTTVASAYALAPFMSYPGSATTSPAPQAVPYVGGSSTNTVGLANAFATVSNLADVSTGQTFSVTPAYAGKVTAANTSYVPQARINTLANALSSCVNSTGGSAGDTTTCGQLFTDTTPKATSVVPTDTLQAILNLAKTQMLPSGSSTSANANLYTLSTYNGAPFSPQLNGAPTDWTLALGFTGGGFGSVTGGVSDDTVPSSIAIDAIGHIWIGSGSPNPASFGPYSSTGFVAELDNLGAPVSGSTTSTTLGGYRPAGMNQADSLAIDPTGNVWVGGGDSGIYVLSSGGGAAASPVTTLSSLAVGAVGGLAFDVTGNLWAGTNPGDPSCGSGASLNEFSPTGTAYSSTYALGYTSGSSFDGTTGFTCGLQQMGFDPSGNLWIEDGAQGFLHHVIASTQVDDQDYAGTDFGINAAGDILTYNGSTDTLAELTPGSPMYTTIPINNSIAANDVAVDGSQRIWAAGPNSGSQGNGFLEAFSSSNQLISPATIGFTGSTDSETTGETVNLLAQVNGDPGTQLAIDGSGNVWVVNGPQAQYQLVEFVGLAAPVITPFATAVKNATIGNLP